MYEAYQPLFEFVSREIVALGATARLLMTVYLGPALQVDPAGPCSHQAIVLRLPSRNSHWTWSVNRAVGGGYGVNITCKKYGVVLGAASLLT